MTGLQSKPEIPSHWELAYTDKLASHMVQQFRRATGLLADGESPIILANVGIETLCEADWMVNIMVRAYKNQSELDSHAKSSTKPPGSYTGEHRCNPSLGEGTDGEQILAGLRCYTNRRLPASGYR